MFSLQRHVVLLAASGILIATLLFGAYTTTWSRPHNILLDYFHFKERPSRQLHLLLPATASTLNFCRLLLSSTITGYPDPILIGWDGHGKYDGAKSHLFKISETLAYLNKLPASNDDDLALLIDAYDIWLILRPEVMISRYFDLLEKSNERLQFQGLFGRQHGGAEIRNTLFWGPDKICWPVESWRAACWAVPQSPMRQNAFGPDTDTWMVLNRPRWLNSGTLIGPVKDMRDMFKRTMEIVEQTFDENYHYRNSDQYYFQNLWAEQEIERIRLRDGKVRAPVVAYDSKGQAMRGRIPEIPQGQRTEYHVSIDYNATLFQTAAGYTEYLTWMSFNHSSPVTSDSSSRRRRLDELALADDIANSPPPFRAKSGFNRLDDETSNKLGWKDVLLGVNVVTQTIFPLFHVTGDKGFRDRWWSKMWFQPYAEELLAANNVPLRNDEASFIAEIDGVRWTGANMSWVGIKTITRRGAWTDQGMHLDWHQMCGNWEDDLFKRS